MKQFYFLSLFLGLAATGIILGQSISSSLNGVLVDPPGAAVSGASCRLINQGRGAVQATSSSADGRLVFPNVLPGTYRLDVQNTGFKTLQLKDLVVTASEIRSVGNVTLQLGDVRESVSVTAEAAALQLSSVEKSGAKTVPTLYEPAPDQQAAFRWPDGAKAAVALTYDDGIDVDLDHAVPDLEAAHLRGTFYVPGHSESLGKRMEEWRAIARRGHELGNHTLFHPCLRRVDGRERTFVVPERDLDNYTVRRTADEIGMMNTMLFAVDGLNARTLAYTCGDEIAGGASYVNAIRPLFPAARAYKTSYRSLADPRTLDPHRVPSWALQDNTAAEMIAWVEEAMRTGALAVFTFHGVGGGHNINVAREEHRKFLSWLDTNRSRVWTAPFLKVMEHVAAERKRSGIAQ